jgi:Tfp pilus assembly protein PilF
MACRSVPRLHYANNEVIAMKRRLLTAAATILLTARLADAQSAAKQAPTSDAQPLAVLLEQGIYQEETAGNLEAAAKTYHQIVEQAAVGRALVAQALARLAALEVRQKQLDDARKTIERLKTEYPEQKDLIAKAEALLPSVEQNSNGIANRRGPSAEQKAQADELIKQGWQNYRDGKFKPAADLFERATRLNPASSEAWTGCGWANFNGKLPGDVSLHFREALRLDPKNAMALNGTGWLNWQQKSNDEAVKYWQSAVEADASSTSAISGLAESALQKSDFDEAEKWYTKWLELDPMNSDATRGLADLQIRRAAEQKAKTIADEFFKLLDSGKFNDARQLTSSAVTVRFLSDSGVADFDGSRDKPEKEQSGWAEFLKEFRAPLGTSVGRRIESISFGWEGHPDSGRSGAVSRRSMEPPRGPIALVEFHFESKFEHRRNVTEYLGVYKSESGEWKVGRYTIDQPAIPRDPLKR